jgi:large subunit ribosomal protein L22
MRIVLDLIRGKRVPEALSILHFTPNHASVVAEKTLRSAIANFQMKPENARFDVEDLYVRQCSADGGAMLKRVLPAPMGRAFRVRKRSNHLRIVVGDTPTPRIARKQKSRAKKEISAVAPAAKIASATVAPAKASKKKVAAATATTE